tara:strand:+ start:295 stop:453 length:159 start_codon:yes stop_codon:yes gene_type:complete
VEKYNTMDKRCRIKGILQILGLSRVENDELMEECVYFRPIPTGHTSLFLEIG